MGGIGQCGGRGAKGGRTDRQDDGATGGKNREDIVSVNAKNAVSRRVAEFAVKEKGFYLFRLGFFCVPCVSSESRHGRDERA